MNKLPDFKNVPNKYRPIPFWSWNEKLEVSETKRQIDLMNAQGIGGFFMHARGGLQTEYMGEEWYENVSACIEKCKENGMIPWAYDENGWPSGFGNGIVNGKGKEYCQKYLRYEKGSKNTDNTIANVNGYHFYYDVNPFYVDTLNRMITDDFLNNIYTPYYEKFKGELEGFFTDEPQISRNGIPWSLIMPDEYKKAYGEALEPVLIELFVETGNYKDTRLKYWKLVTNLFSDNFMKPVYEWCKAHNFKLTGHLVLEEDLYCQLTTNGACMPHYEYFSIPGMDWLGRDIRDTLTPYQLASVASQTGKDQVLSETFALCGHNIGHDELKRMYEFQMVRGINLLCQHLQGYSNRGIRKRDYPPAMYIQQPWWESYKTFIDTMSRTGMMLSGGDDGVDVLVIHPQTTAWTLYNDSEFYDKENTSAMDAIRKLNDEFMKVLLCLERKHINFHLGDEIMMERHGKVENGKLIIGKKSYSKVIIPPHDVFFENTERLINEFKNSGGIVTTAEELEENNIINIAEITYCKRICKDYTLYYFVNSTENTYDAFIAKGSKRIDAQTGEIFDFDGHFCFRKYDSLIVIDDGSGRKETVKAPKNLIPVDLGGEWTIESMSENILTLDYCDYYFDEMLQEENGYVLNAMYRALDLKRPLKLRCDFHFKADYVPDNLQLVCETPEIFEISINGVKVDKTDAGYFVDKSFRRIDIAKYVVCGNNTITLTTDFCQSDTVYDNIEKGKQFESEKNKLTFDMEIEQIYLIGNFSVATNGKYEDLPKNASRYTGDFVITNPKISISLKNIEQQGFPFFAGNMTVSKTFNVTDDNMMLSFKKRGINVVDAKINGVEIKKFMWEPYFADITSLVCKGENKLELTLTGNLRNMQGPLHLEEGESYSVCPLHFYKESCVWNWGYEPAEWNDDYCFVDVTIETR
ncbi:MAG: hypothetical protein E7395_04610 [Ruminococcaceae bacterium]|nr:hypothetical protein [Oscillospiraceae bacterium]